MEGIYAKFNTSKGMCGLRPSMDTSYLYFFNDNKNPWFSNLWPLGYKKEVIGRVKAHYAKNH